MYRYTIMQEHLCAPDGGLCLSYGIRGFRKTVTGWKAAAKLTDVSLSEETVGQIVRLCNVGHVPPKHLTEFVAAFLDC